MEVYIWTEQKNTLLKQKSRIQAGDTLKKVAMLIKREFVIYG